MRAILGLGWGEGGTKWQWALDTSFDVNRGENEKQRELGGKEKAGLLLG